MAPQGYACACTQHTTRVRSEDGMSGNSGPSISCAGATSDTEFKEAYESDSNDPVVSSLLDHLKCPTTSDLA